MALAGLSFVALGGQKLSAETLAYIEPESGRLAYIEPVYGPRIYLGDEQTRLGRAHFLHGDYGLAELHFRKAVESTPRNGAAWVGLAASYDRLARFDLADRAYRRAAYLGGPKYMILNNHGYSYLLRGNIRQARTLFYKAHELAPNDPTIINNISIMESGQAYFWNRSP